ncbi:MAG: hypothetical protein J5942_08765, partial [Prevotella sp.]|nr:hypothetical protein [Prevotella sp.]
LTEGQKDMILPFISDRRTKEHNLPPFGRVGVGFPSSPREGRGGLLHHLLGRAGVGFSIIFSGGPGWASPSSSREGRGWFLQTIATAQKPEKYQAENQQVPNGKAKQVVLVCNKGQIAMQ